MSVGDPRDEALTQSLPGSPASAGDRSQGASPAPERIGSYVIRRLIGQGGMGAVYEAEQANPHRAVALKLVRGDRISERALQRFREEPQVLGRLQHPGIAQIYEAGTAMTAAGEQPFFAMELVRGRRLDHYVAEERLTLRNRVQLVVKAATAIHYAHEQGVVHCDLKPANILIDGTGMPKILDFGVALTAKSLLDRTQEEVGGTIAYMSPEQTTGDPRRVDRRADVYALGVITYELLEGDGPYHLEGTTAAEATRVICEQEPSALKHLARVLRWEIQAVIRKALNKTPALRHATALEFAEDLNRVVNATPMPGHESVWASAYRWSMREDRVRQAAFGAMIYGVIAAFNLCFSAKGLLQSAGVWEPDPGVVPLTFALETGIPGLVLAMMAWLTWQISEHDIRPLVGALIGSAILTVFTWLVLAGAVDYDIGGALPLQARLALYSLLAPLASCGLLLNGFALLAAYRLRLWSAAPPRTACA